MYHYIYDTVYLESKIENRYLKFISNIDTLLLTLVSPRLFTVIFLSNASTEVWNINIKQNKNYTKELESY